MAAPGEVKMRAKQMLMLAASMLLVFLSSACSRSPAEDTQRRVVRIAELEIDPAQLESYKALLREQIETSIRVEPGVLTLYAVSLKDNPAHIRIFETYAGVDAYNSHVQTPHFQKYKKGTQHMVKSLRLVETDPFCWASSPIEVIAVGPYRRDKCD
jgi:quinol monooxygenase YgiN